MFGFILAAAALLPAIVLCIYVFKKDRVEKEPIGLLAKLLLFGVLSVIPVLLMSPALQFIEGILFYGNVWHDGEELYYSSLLTYYLYHFFDAFIVVALLEEVAKFVMLLLGTKNNKNFNSLFDGMIYAIFVSLGFAAFENIMYVLDGGLSVALTRAILSVPGHMFFAVMMGYYYSLWHVVSKAKSIESRLKASGLVSINTPTVSAKKYVVLSLIVPIAAHGLFDFCLFASTLLTLAIFFAFVIFMYVYCFGKIRKMSSADASDMSYAKYIVIRKYPHLSEYIRNNF